MTTRERLVRYLRSPSPTSGQHSWSALLVGFLSLYWAMNRAIDATRSSGTWPLLWRWGLAAFFAAVAVTMLGGEALRWWRGRNR